MLQSHVDEFNNLDALKDDAPNETKVKRGHDFEKLLNNIFEEEDILVNRGFHTSDNRSEQIDGAISICSRIFLVEVKWVQSNIAASELYSFIGKVENKFHGTLGLFISRNELTDNFIKALNRGRRQSVIVLHGEDLDLLFTHKIEFKKYLKKAHTILSYDNVSHYPVKNFIDDEKTSLDTIKVSSNVSKNVNLFIHDNLTSNIKNGTDMLKTGLSLSQDEHFEIFKYVVSNYSKFWDAEVKNFKFIVTSNFETYLETFALSGDLIKKYAGTFYSEIVPKSLYIYSRANFVNIFSPYYKTITIDQKDTFENFITASMKNKFGVYDSENQITALVQGIWRDFKEETVNELASFIYQIYISSRLIKFAQMQFANQIMQKNQLGSERLKSWLDERIKNNLDNFEFEDEDNKYVIRLIISIYNKLGPHLELGEVKFIDYITSRVKAIKENLS